MFSKWRWQTKCIWEFSCFTSRTGEFDYPVILKNWDIHIASAVDAPFLVILQVANEIRESGGKAVANFDNVEDGERIIQKVVSEFGKVGKRNLSIFPLWNTATQKLS